MPRQISIFFVSCLLLVCNACTTINTNKETAPSLFVEATGFGSDKKTALQDAFRDAIQKTYGAFVTTESRLDNQRLTKDIVSEYSSAIISKYELLGEGRAADGRYKVDIAALVSSSKLLDYVMAKSKPQGPTNADGSQIYAQVSTALKSKQQSDKLLKSILSDFPRPALKASVGTLTSRIDQDRQVFLRVPYKVEWNDSFVKSFEQIVEYVSYNTCKKPTADQSRCQFDILFSTGFWRWSPRTGYKFADNIQYKAVQQALSTQAAITVSFIDQDDRTIGSVCRKLNLYNNYIPGPLQLGSKYESTFQAPLLLVGEDFIQISEYSIEGMIETPVNFSAIDSIKSMVPLITSGCDSTRSK